MSSPAAKLVSVAKSRGGAARPTGLYNSLKRKRRTPAPITFRRAEGVDAYVHAVFSATPLEIVEIERHGVSGVFIKELSRRMEVPASRIFHILGVPKATAEKKAAAGQLVSGSGGQAAVGMIKLLGIAQSIDPLAKPLGGVECFRFGCRTVIDRASRFSACSRIRASVCILVGRVLVQRHAPSAAAFSRNGARSRPSATNGP